MGVKLDPSVIRAINKFARTPMGRKYGRWAKKNHSMSGKKLMAKTVAGESGGRGTGKAGMSSAGARGPAQFIPSTREAYISQYGVDPWKNDLSAMKGMAIHHMGTGVAGYNPGMPTYTSYILGQKVDKDSLNSLRTGGRGAKPSRGSRPGRGTVTQTTDVPGVDNSALRRQMLQGYLLERNDPNALLNLVTGLEGAKDIPGSTATSQTKGPRYKRGKKKRYQGKSSVKGLQVRKDQNHGAKSLAEQAGRGFVTSGERTPAENAAVGGASGSDHLSTNRWASAVDMKYGTGRQVAKRLGLKNWKPGTYDRHTVTVGGRKYSVQILENVEGHYDHTHLGVQRVK